MASNDLRKLTVPQLKALCKEKRITGYSKLSKAALLQKLAEVAVPTQTATPSNHQAGQSVTVVSTSTREVRSSAYIEAPVQQGVSLANGNADSTGSSTLPTEPPKSSEARTVASSTGTHKTSNTKRPAHIDNSAPPKRIRTSQLNSVTNAIREPPVQTALAPQRILPVDNSVFKVPELPVQPKKSLQGNVSTPVKPPSGTSGITGGSGRFKPLAISKPKPVEPDHKNTDSTMRWVTDSTRDFSFHTTPLPVLSSISFPPKASERKWVHRWAIILGALSETDRRACTLVSRTFRYATYLSAGQILSRNYSGRRLDNILEQYSGNMTNLWPYLRFRTIEVSERRHAFKQSFLGRYAESMRYDPLSSRLWTSPDNEKQVSVALRFVLTRMWFATSVGSYGHDASSWSECVVRDAQEIVKGEVWRVVTQDNKTGKSCDFYALEATCEVIGQPPSSQGQNALGYCLRADWTAWVSQRSQTPSGVQLCSLLECIRWSNTEDYHQGMSKAWLRRVQGQDADNIAKKNVAKKYILASVVANGISGQWMSATTMAQEFAGLPGRDVTGAKSVVRSMNTVNMYLPAHHHIESVHFATSKGEALHAAVAAVQTPGREYYVLRDNGMQVGCEEDGVAEVWQKILDCDMLGRAR